MNDKKRPKRSDAPTADGALTYDADEGAYHAEFSPGETDAIPDVVVFALAEIRGEDPVDLTPLGEVVDPDALGRIVRQAAGTGSDVSVTFEYCGHDVSVDADGVRIRERE